MNLSSKNLIKILQENGYVFSRSKGSHQLFYNASFKQNSSSASTWKQGFKKRHLFNYIETGRN